MLDPLKTLLENNVISEEVKASIEEAWETRINEQKKSLREEYAQKYEHDKGLMTEAIDNMLNEHLRQEIQEFVEDRKQLSEMKVRYAKKIKEDSHLLKEFVVKQLATEINELHEDQKLAASRFGKLESFVIEALAEEITEFFEDKKDLAETKVRMIKEGKKELAKVKQTFVKKAAKLVEEAVHSQLSAELTALKEDIQSARENDFGRKLFEAFATEYRYSYLNEKSEIAKLLKSIEKQEATLKEAALAVVKAEKLLEHKEKQVQVLKESNARHRIIGELIAPLSVDQREIMSELMERVATSKLKESFEKYLPAVLAGQEKTISNKERLMESKAKVVTGNKNARNDQKTEVEANIVDIRRLAGLKV